MAQVVDGSLRQILMGPVQVCDAWSMVWAFHYNWAYYGLETTRDRVGRHAGRQRRHMNAMDTPREDQTESQQEYFIRCRWSHG